VKLSKGVDRATRRLLLREEWAGPNDEYFPCHIM
jgi:hypothetical protein